MTNLRTRWIDIAKGIGILLVTIGHSRFGESGWSAIWINSFHMPLFFVMAGLCYDETRYPSCWGYLISILGVAAVSGFSMLVDSLQKCAFIPRALAWLGKYSILLLAIHGSCGTCRHSWGERWTALAGWPSQVLEIVLLVILMWLLSGPLNFFMKPPKFIKERIKS